MVCLFLPGLHASACRSGEPFTRVDHPSWSCIAASRNWGCRALDAKAPQQASLWNVLLQASSDDIRPADDSQSILADRDALEQGAARDAAALPAIRTNSRGPGRTRSSRSLLGRAQDMPSATDDMVAA